MEKVEEKNLASICMKKNGNFYPSFQVFLCCVKCFGDVHESLPNTTAIQIGWDAVRYPVKVIDNFPSVPPDHGRRSRCFAA